MRAVFLCNEADNPARVYSVSVCELLAEKAGLRDYVYSEKDVLQQPELFADTEYIFSTWGMPQLNEEQIRTYFPCLRCIFYAAGSVQYFARPFLNCGVRVFSAWAANAVPVAEYTLAQIILANKGFYATARLQSCGEVAAADTLKHNYRGNYGDTVGIIGVGMIGTLVCEMLKNYNLKIKVFDPFLSEEKAERLGVEKCSLEELFSQCCVVSNHLADNAQTKGMLNGSLFASMRPYAVFLNTGRGAQVIEDDLAAVLQKRPDLTAVLDVTMPEPPVQGHPFYTLPNCILTPHIAGSSGDELYRMAEYMADEFIRIEDGDKCRYEVTEEMLATMA